MAFPTKYGNSGEEDFVDIHGRVLPFVRTGTGELAFPLTELKQTGVGIYQKSQYIKLAAMTKKFDEDFNIFMLEAAKNYMLSNKICFNEDQILRTISNCKEALTSNSKKSPEKQIFLKNRSVAETPNNEIQIKVTNQPAAAATPVSSHRRKLTNFKIRSSISPIQSVESESSLNTSPNSANQSSLCLPKTQKRSVSPIQSVESASSLNISPNSANQSILRLPKTQAAPQHSKRFQYNRSPVEHDVIVTRIDKRNCIWVRDRANDELFAKVYEMVNEEAEHQRVPLKPWEMDRVYMACDDGLWFRCKIVRYLPLTVLFLDYGNTAEVSEIREVSEELAKIPSLAVRITFKESEYNPRLEDEIRIKIFLTNVDGTFFVNVVSHSEQAPQLSGSGFFGKPSYIEEIQHGMRVAIIHEDNSVLFVRNLKSFQKLKDIERQIEEYLGAAQPIANVQVDQVVLCKDHNGKYCRAITKSITETSVEVEFLDFVKSATVDPLNLRSINEELASQPLTYLQGLHIKGLSKAHKGTIEQFIKTQKKFTLVVDSDDNLNLTDGTNNLLQLLDCQQTTEKRNCLNTKHFQPEFGINPYVCGSYRNSKDFTLVPSKELSDNIDTLLRHKVDDLRPHLPTVGEVCLCFYIDHWYRCIVTRKINNSFEVLLLDFGNIEIVEKENLRKADSGVAQVPALAIPCRLVNLPDVSNVEEMLKGLVLEGEIYNADVRSLEDGKYCVMIPSVYQKLDDW